MTRRQLLGVAVVGIPLFSQVREIVPFRQVLQQATAQYKHLTREANAAAARLCQEALVLEPTSPRAHALLAATHRQDWTYAWSADPDASLVAAEECATQAVALAKREPTPHPALPSALLQLGYVYLSQRRHPLAVHTLEAAIAHTPTYADGYAALAYVFTYAGEPERALQMMNLAEAYARDIPAYYDHHAGQAAYVAGYLPYAERRLRMALDKEPDFRSPRTYLVATLWEQGSPALAAYETAILHRLGRPVIKTDPDAFRAYAIKTHPFTNPQTLGRLLTSWTAAETMLETIG